jgi:hypothetical protein
MVGEDEEDDDDKMDQRLQTVIDKQELKIQLI